MQIKDISAVVSGGASGMGAATAKQLVSLGAKVSILDTNQESAQQLAKEIGAHAFVCDVTQAFQVSNVFAEVAKLQGHVRIVVHCAGIAPAKRLVGRDGPMSSEAFMQVISVNLLGTFNMMRACAYPLSQQEPINADGERGVIINTASIAAFEGQIGQIAYSASKAGVAGMTLPAARELAQFGIRVVTIAPGLIATPMLLNMPAAVQESLGNQVPFPKRLGKPEEYARLACHIIENPMINGEVIRLDGAMRMQER